MASEQVMRVDNRIQWSKQPEQPACDETAYQQFAEFVRGQGAGEPMKHAVYMAAVLGLMFEGCKPSAIEKYLSDHHRVSRPEIVGATALADAYITEWLAASDEPREIARPESEVVTVSTPEVTPRKLSDMRSDTLALAGELEAALRAIFAGEKLQDEQAIELLVVLRDRIYYLLTEKIEPGERLTSDEAKYLKALVGMRIELRGKGFEVEHTRPKSVQEIKGNVARGHGDVNGAERAIYEGLAKILPKLESQSVSSAA